MSFRPASGSTYTRDSAAAAEASRFRYEDDQGTHFEYTPAYDAASEGGATAADARAGFTAGYYSVPDAELLRRAQEEAAGPAVKGPRLRVRDFPQAWHKIDDAEGHAAATRASVAAAGFAYSGGGTASGSAPRSGEDWSRDDTYGSASFDDDDTALRREAARRRAEADWRKHQQEAQRASESEAAEAASKAEADRAAQEAEDLAYAMALSASQSSDDPDARLLAELELAEAKKGSANRQRTASSGNPAASDAYQSAGDASNGGGGSNGGAGGAPAPAGDKVLGRSKGQALAARYWISLCLDGEEELDASCDGFYDLWGDFSELEDAEGGRCPSLKALLSAPGKSPGTGAPREALLIDRRTDALLAERCRLLADDVATNNALARSPEARAAYLGRYVANALGGAVGGEADTIALATSWSEAANTLRAAARSCVLRLGDLPVGLPRHRALLFKVLSPLLHLKCRLVRGAYYCDGDDSCARVILLTDEGYEYDVDLMLSPGKLTAPPGFVPPTPAADASTREGARAAEGLPKETPEMSGAAEQKAGTTSTTSSAAGGNRFRLPGTPSGAAAAAGGADTQPRGAATPPRPAAAATPPGDTGAMSDEDVTEEDVTVAELMSAYGCTAELAFEALMQADYHLQRAHLLCQGAAILGATVREVYDLLVLSGWNLKKAVQTHMDVMEEGDQEQQDHQHIAAIKRAMQHSQAIKRMCPKPSGKE